MYIFHFTNKHTTDYDQVEAAVVIAPSQNTAREIVIAKMPSWDLPHLWRDSTKVVGKSLGHANKGEKARIVCLDIHEG